MTWEVPSRAAKRGGQYGLRVDVAHPFDPPWKAKIALGSVWAVGGLEQLAVTYWARAEPGSGQLPAPHTDVTDIDEGYQWLGDPSPCELSHTEWRQCRAAVPIDPKRKGHALDVAIVVGHTKGVIYVDDVTVVQQLAPPPSPPAASPPAPPLSPSVLSEDFGFSRGSRGRRQTSRCRGARTPACVRPCTPPSFRRPWRRRRPRRLHGRPGGRRRT